MTVLPALVLPAPCHPMGAARVCQTQNQIWLLLLLLPFFLIMVPCSNQPSWSWVLFPVLGQHSQKVFPPQNMQARGAVQLTTPLPRGGLCRVDAAGNGPPP